MTISVIETPGSPPTLQLEGPGTAVSIRVNFSESVPSDLLQRIVASPRFVAWINSYLPRPQQRLRLQGITFESVEVNSDDETIGFIKLTADVTRMPEDSDVGGTVLLSGPSVAVLVVFRVNPDGSRPGSENAPVYRPSDPNAATVTGPRPREHVLLVKQARPAVGAPDHREIPSGLIGTDGAFSSPAFNAIREACGLRMYESQVEDLTSLALSVKRSPSRSLGVSLSPAALDERVRLFLYRETVTQQFIDSFQKNRNGGGGASPISVDLWTLNDAWRVTSDARTLSALFLFHELRYHQLMPRYRQPREIKKSPQYTSVSDLNPNQTGLNLRVKVSEPLRMIPHPTRVGIEKGIVVVGDATGVVTLSLDAAQTSLTPGFQQPGSSLFLRNVEFDMSDGHITLVLDSFGKVSVPTEEEMAQFEFTVDKKNDMSVTEYEKVFQSEGSSPAYQNYATGVRGSRGGRGSRGRGTRQRGNGRVWNQTRE